MDNAKGWLQYLSDEDAIFIKNFMLSSGSLKTMSQLYQISYPTLRRRLDQLIQKIHMYNQAPDDVFVTLIRSLMMDKRIDIQTAQILIKNYQELHTPPAPIEEISELRTLKDLKHLAETSSLLDTEEN
ncbi:DUF2089 family protein [Alloscardovia omnicolens]|uniref:DUF2089 family protein n=1 Tax=Alloscardovia omnicolens TaxID=419015 RepID=UPI003A70693C